MENLKNLLRAAIAAYDTLCEEAAKRINAPVDEIKKDKNFTEDDIETYLNRGMLIATRSDSAPASPCNLIIPDTNDFNVILSSVGHQYSKRGYCVVGQFTADWVLPYTSQPEIVNITQSNILNFEDLKLRESTTRVIPLEHCVVIRMPEHTTKLAAVDNLLFDDQSRSDTWPEDIKVTDYSYFISNSDNGRLLHVCIA